MQFISSENLVKIRHCFDLNPEKQGRFLQNSEIEIQKIESELLSDCECIVMCMTLHEKIVFENEILTLVRDGLMPNLKEVIFTHKGIKTHKIGE